jgi:uncharacterized protein YggE
MKRIAAGTALSLMIVMFAISCLADETTRVIEVSGTGEARSAPDVANLSLQIETHAATAEETSSKNAALAQKVVKELKDRLAGKGTVETGDYSLNPEYADNNTPRQKPVITGYSAQNTITVETTELPLLGSLIDGAISAGANRINYLNFGLRDDAKAREAAIANASKDAQAQAQALATSLNVKLKRVVKASTIPERGPVMPMARMNASFASVANAPTPVEASQISVSATVALTYEIE